MAELEHRIVEVVTADPWYALLMLKEPRLDVPCHTRQTIVRNIIGTADANLTVNL